MGTRVDFYVGKGKEAKWLGSYPWDGYPSEDKKEIFEAKTEEEFVDAVNKYLILEDGIFAKDGWPWPWKNSCTTDYAYCFFDSKVWGSCFGHKWFDPLIDDYDDIDNEQQEFPEMDTSKRLPPGHPKSGILVVTFKKGE